MSRTLNEHGTAKVSGVIMGLFDIPPSEKLYLLAFGEVEDPEHLRRYACLTEERADRIRRRLIKRGWIRADGRLDLDAIQSR